MKRAAPKPTWYLEKFKLESDPSFRLDEEHRYWLGNVQIPGLTNCLKQGGLVDTRFYKETGRRRGSVVHAACHYLDEGDLNWATLDEEALAFVRGYEKFKKEWNWRPRCREFPMYHRLLKYGFTMDGEGPILKKDMAIVEIKTGKMQDWTAIQTTGQKAGIESWDVHPVKRRRFGVELPGNGDYHIKEFTGKNEVRVFLSTLNITNWKWVPSVLPTILQEANNGI